MLVLSPCVSSIETSSNPLQIQIVKENKKHIITSNKKLKGSQKTRHDAVKIKLETIINNAVYKYKKPVDITHNTSEKTIKHKKKVLEYLYFENPIKVYDDYYIVTLATERVVNQDPDILDLYNIKTKKTDAAMHLSTNADHQSINTLQQTNTYVNKNLTGQVMSP